jgi:phenylpropionate dioxygenase-like ring-hydroxylating dioxygenase large terminal subunit
MFSADRGLWKNYWHLLCHRSEVKNGRDFVRFDVAGEEVVAFHDGSETIAFNNLCPHRGARIFDGPSGNAPFVCRYHGWSYSKGKVFVADKEQFAHCDLSSLKLETLKTAWVGDFLFVSTTPIYSVETQLGSVAQLIHAISSDICERSDLNTYEYKCIWQIAVENALEPYHVNTIHPKTLNLLKLSHGRNEYHHVNSVWYSELDNQKSAKRLTRISKLFALNFQHLGYLNIYLFPFSMISSTFGLSYSIQNFFPSMHENQTHFTSRLYQSHLKPDVNPALLEGFFSSTAEQNRQIFKEDMEICSRIPARSWAIDALKIFANDEERIQHFRKTYQDRLIKNH